MIAQRRDKNEMDIVNAARTFGGLVLPMDRRAGFDLLIVTEYGNLIVEVKDPGENWRLTKHEESMRVEVTKSGGDYYIVETVEEMVDLVRDDQDMIRTLLEKGDRRAAI
jgi:hypothetical protein